MCINDFFMQNTSWTIISHTPSTAIRPSHAGKRVMSAASRHQAFSGENWSSSQPRRPVSYFLQSLIFAVTGFATCTILVEFWLWVWCGFLFIEFGVDVLVARVWWGGFRWHEFDYTILEFGAGFWLCVFDCDLDYTSLIARYCWGVCRANFLRQFWLYDEFGVRYECTSLIVWFCLRDFGGGFVVWLCEFWW